MLKCEKCIHNKICIDGANYKNAEACRNFVNENDFVPVKHGRWIYGKYDIPHCSECGSEVMPNNISLFCPNCGAKMDGGDDNGT